MCLSSWETSHVLWKLDGIMSTLCLEDPFWSTPGAALLDATTVKTFLERTCYVQVTFLRKFPTGAFSLILSIIVMDYCQGVCFSTPKTWWPSSWGSWLVTTPTRFLCYFSSFMPSRVEQPPSHTSSMTLRYDKRPSFFFLGLEKIAQGSSWQPSPWSKMPPRPPKHKSEL